MFDTDRERSIKLGTKYKEKLMAQTSPNSSTFKLHSPGRVVSKVSSRYGMVRTASSEHTTDGGHDIMGPTRYGKMMEEEAAHLDRHARREAKLHARIKQLRARRNGAVQESNPTSP